MASTVGRGTQSMNAMYIKPMLQKAAYHKKGNPAAANGGDAVKMNGEEIKGKGFAGDHYVNVNGNDPEWVPDHRTGIFYPKGQEKVIADIPPAPAAAGKDDDVRINWFSNHEDFI